MRVTPNERWNGHWRQRGSGMRIGLRACRTLREQNFGMERRMNFGMTRVARAVQRKSLFFNSLVWLGREDSNLRMAESKSAALPLGYAPSGGCLRRGGARTIAAAIGPING